MRCAALLLMFSLSGSWGLAQAETTALVPHVVGNQFHSNVLTLVNMTGLRDELLRNRHTVAEEGKQVILHSFPSYDPAFADEWARRMERSSVDDYLSVVVAVYEKNYSNEDVLEMIQVQRDLSADRQPVLSIQLRSKLARVAPTVENEITSGFKELGAKQGEQVGEEVAKEHPEWLRSSESSKSDAKPVN